MKYALELEHDTDGAVIDYSVEEIEPDEILPEVLDRMRLFDTEDEAEEAGRQRLIKMNHCAQCGNMHRADQPNPCFCQVCGMPTADGHWHPNV